MDPHLHLDEILTTLKHGNMALAGQFLWGSNYTFLVQTSHNQTTLRAVYKPSRGARPLWDFPPDSLAKREVAAYITSESLGWGLVPPTVMRDEAPAGPGSVQLFVDLDPSRHYFTFTDEEKQLLRPAALFDVLVNNADRKAGHVLLGPDDHVWLIDHGVCFHHQFKLRTVIWDFVGEPIQEPLLSDVHSFHQRLQDDIGMRAKFAEWLSPEEIESMVHRASVLLTERRFPSPAEGRPFPWPLV